MGPNRVYLGFYVIYPASVRHGVFRSCRHSLLKWHMEGTCRVALTSSCESGACHGFFPCRGGCRGVLTWWLAVVLRTYVQRFCFRGGSRSPPRGPAGGAPRPPARSALRAPRAGALLLILVRTHHVSESVRKGSQCVYQVYISVSGYACEREVLQYCCE